MQNRSSRSVRIFYPRVSREEVLRRLTQSVPTLRDVLPITRLVLFGSYAHARHTVASDIDVLIIYDGPPRADAYAIARKAIPLRGLEPHLYTTSEADARQNTIARMTEEGVVIYDRDAEQQAHLASS